MRMVLFGALLLNACVYYRVEPRPQRLGLADAIMVPGYALPPDGSVPPIIYNRMNMASLLWRCGFADWIIVSGGKPQNGRTEAEVMAELGVSLGIPADRILVENQAETSVQNGAFSARIARDAGFRSVLIVTDPVHLSYALPVFKDAFYEAGVEVFWLPVDYELLGSLGVARRVNPLAR